MHHPCSIFSKKLVPPNHTSSAVDGAVHARRPVGSILIHYFVIIIFILYHNLFRQLLLS